MLDSIHAFVTLATLEIVPYPFVLVIQPQIVECALVVVAVLVLIVAAVIQTDRELIANYSLVLEFPILQAMCAVAEEHAPLQMFANVQLALKELNARFQFASILREQILMYAVDMVVALAQILVYAMGITVVQSATNVNQITWDQLVLHLHALQK